jgi:hypothetical protein
MSEQPTSPNDILLQVIQALKDTQAQNEQLKKDLDALKQVVVKDIPEAIDKQMTSLSEAVSTGFKMRDEAITRLSETSLAAPQPAGNQGGGIAQTISSLLEKVLSGQGGAPNAISGNPIANSLEQMATDNFKTQLKIMQYQSQTMLKQAAKAAGVPIEALEDVSHIVVDV